MALANAALAYNDVQEEYLHSTFALDLLTQQAIALSPAQFSQEMAGIFGDDIPQHIYLALQERLIAKEVDAPEILVDYGNSIADYDNRERVVRVHSSVLHNAVHNIRSAEFLDILFHEFGHHIDNVLRKDFTHCLDAGLPPLAPDASGEEGSRFSYWMASQSTFDDEQVCVATYRLTPCDSHRPIEMDWSVSRHAVLKRHHKHQTGTESVHIHPDREAFEAGEGDEHHLTHQRIESVMAELGLGRYELETIYFGNWLRDYSQLLDPKIVRATEMPKDFPDVLSRDALTRIVDILSVKPFKSIRQSGGALYHVTPQVLGVYRPSEHIDNPKSMDGHAPDPRTRDQDFEPLVFEGDPLLDVDYDTSMKRYITRSMDYMESELRIAMAHKDSPVGLRAFGSALHVLEDFFAHSNFVELALIKNGNGDVLPWTSPARCRAGLPLVTGMFGSTDVLASLAGPLGKILFSVDDVAYMPIKAGDRSPREQVLLILLEEHHNPRYLEIFQEFLTIRDSWVGLPAAEFIQRCANYLIGAAAVPGNAVAIVMKDVLTLFGESVDDWQTRYGQDPHDNGSTDPTHSQLAKDHGEHPLHLIAGSLATHAVKEVATHMISHWKSGFGADPVRVARAYFKHPHDSRWQDPLIKKWAADHPEELRRSASKTELLELHRHFAQTGSKALEQMRKDSAAYLAFMRGEFADKNSPLWLLFSLTTGGNIWRQVLIQLGLIK